MMFGLPVGAPCRGDQPGVDSAKVRPMCPEKWAPGSATFNNSDSLDGMGVPCAWSGPRRHRPPIVDLRLMLGGTAFAECQIADIWASRR